MCNKILKVRNSCVGVEFLTFDLFLRSKAVKKLMGNEFCTPIIFIDPIERQIRFLALVLFDSNLLELKQYISYSKQDLIGLLRIIGMIKTK